MAEDSDTQTGTTPVRDAHRFDEAALARWMEANVGGYKGPLTVEQFRGGQSNPTYKLRTLTRDYVLRRKPPGKLLPGAHAVDREARVLGAVEKGGLPVAHVHGLCTDDAVIGTWFYVMDMVEGRIFWDARFPEATREERPLLFDAMNETIAQLHGIDPEGVGLGDYGRPGNYFQRQIARWSRQYVEDVDAGTNPHMDRLVEWLPGHIPPADDTREETSIVHGDFRADNMIFHPTEPRVIAVLDWELSTLGHPLADFAYHAMMYRMPSLATSGLAGADLRELNIPTEQDYVAAHCRRTGRSGIPNYDFYAAFNFFRLAAIIHGIKGRVVRGTAASAQAEARANALPAFAKLAWDQAVRAGAPGETGRP